MISTVDTNMAALRAFRVGETFVEIVVLWKVKQQGDRAKYTFSSEGGN
jgi:hypothetical protein